MNKPNDKLAGKINLRAAKSISDAPNLRDRYEAACGGCAFFKVIEGAMTNEGICTLYDTLIPADYVCDSFEAIPAPDVVEQVAEAIVEAMPEMAVAENMLSLKETGVSARGGEIKALGDGHYGGYLVRFGSPDDTDADGEYFDANTDFGFGMGEEITSPVWLNHCQPLRFGDGKKAIAVKEPIGNSSLKMVDDGIIIDAILFERAQYEKVLDKLGWSSGTADHTWKKRKNGKAIHIDRWHLGLDASMTPKHADPRNSILAIKSLTQHQEAEPEATIPMDAAQATVTASQAGKSIQNAALKTAKEREEMAELQEVLDAVNGLKTETSSNVKTMTARIDMLETALKKEPAINGGGGTNVTDIKDPADRPFKSLAEYCYAVREYELAGKQTDQPRLKYLKALGASEGIPTDGGLLLDPTLSSEFIMPVHREGVFSSKVDRQPVSANSNYGWINGLDETSRATGSRYGGVQGYWLAEAGTKLPSKPKFRRVNWELHKAAALIYGTDELLQDSAQFSKTAREAARAEIMFMVNDSILNGTGVGMPLGILNSNAKITVTRDTGSAVLHADIINMWARLAAESQASAEWFINAEVGAYLNTLYFTGSTSVMSPYVGYTPSGTMTLMGRPVNTTEFNAGINTTGDILLADMSQYYLWEKANIQEEVSIHVAFLTDESVFRFVYRVDGKPKIAAPMTPYKGTATTGPFVVLGSAT